MIRNLIKIIDSLNNYNCPWIGFGNDEETSIEMQWRKNEKAITIFLEDNIIYYLKSWGPRIIDDMEDGEIAEFMTYQETAIYRSDDRDVDDNDLLIYQGGNGDWYLTIVPHGQKIGPTVRITTDGVPRGYSGTASIVHKLYEKLIEANKVYMR